MRWCAVDVQKSACVWLLHHKLLRMRVTPVYFEMEIERFLCACSVRFGYFDTTWRAHKRYEYKSAVFTVFTLPPARRATYCDRRVCISVCLFVCLSARALANLKHHVSKFYEILLYMLPVAVAFSLVLIRQQCDTLCTSGFVNDITFHIIQQMGENQRRHACFVEFAKVTASGGKSAVFYFILYCIV